MLIVLTVLWWSILIGGFNTIVRAHGFTYGGTPRKTALFYFCCTALTLALFAPMSFAWSFVEPLKLLILIPTLSIIAFIDWEIAQTYPPADRTWVWYGTLVKYTDIFFQQLLVFLLFTSIAAHYEYASAHVAVFAIIFTMIHLPVFVVMPRTIAWTFLLASLCGGILFPLLYIYTPTSAAFSAFALHTLFYTVLRAFEHHSDMWVKYIERD